ncbi:ribonuclease Z [Candidatus Woesearchaeota archaeon]|nr:ribonuclease Z [Candidatus Woesearchaeota archaeon]
MKITFLGTSAMQPTKERNLSAILLNYENENILVDCGEGTQRQFRLIDLKPTKITKILISHMHGDHIFGLPGLIQNLEVNNYNGMLEIYGPKGIKEFFNFLFKLGVFKKLKYKIIEIKEGIICKEKNFMIKASKLNHYGLCYGFEFLEKDKRKINLDYLKKFGLKQHPIIKNLQQGKSIIWEKKKIDVNKATTLIKGKKIAFVLDTVYCNNCLKLAKDADLVISEATFTDDLREKAKEYKHLTAKQAAEIAKKSKAKKLVLTHFSQRYKDINDVLKEAKSVFKETICAEDFLEINLQ